MNSEVARALQSGAGLARSAPLVRDIGDWAIRSALRSGDLHRVNPRVLGSGDGSLDLAARVLRAEVLIGRPVIAYGPTAAALHGIVAASSGPLHLTTFDGWSARAPEGVVVHQAPPRSEPLLLSGIHVTARADTAIDLARMGREIDVLAVLDAALRAGIAQDELEAACLLAGRRRGVAQVRDWLPYADWRSESSMESRTRFRFLDAGLPAPDLQIPVEVADGSYRFPDLGWREARVGCDYDSEQFHSGEAMLGDRRRHNEVTNVGWRMFYATHRDIYRDPTDLLAQLARPLQAAGYLMTGRRVDPDLIPRPAGPAAELLHRSRLLWSRVRPSG